MLTKGFYSGFLYMAKSQYTDSIDPNNILLREYNIGDKLYAESSYKITYNKFRDTPILENGGKYWNKQYRIYNSGDFGRTFLYNINTANSNNFNNKLTISCWVKYLDEFTNETNGGIQLISFNNTTNFELRLGNILVAAGKKLATQIYQNSAWGNWRFSSSSLPDKNTWYHVGCTLENRVYKTYLNGQLVITNNDLQYDFATNNIYQLSYYNNYVDNFYIEDLTVIMNQLLWTSNFTVPNYLLLGDKELPNRIYNKNKSYPSSKCIGDYFDKAFLY